MLKQRKRTSTVFECCRRASCHAMRGQLLFFFLSYLSALWVVVPVAGAQSLNGSRSSVNRQELQAQQHDLTYMETEARVRRFVDANLLVEVPGNANYDLHDVSQPFARPAVKLFIDRLSAQYRSACGEKLTVTSLTRPLNRQPRNASDQSVHPTGIALDLRVPNRSSCRSWLNRVLLSLEGANVLEATRERSPPPLPCGRLPGPVPDVCRANNDAGQPPGLRCAKRGLAVVTVPPDWQHRRIHSRSQWDHGQPHFCGSAAPHPQLIHRPPPPFRFPPGDDGRRDLPTGSIDAANRNHGRKLQRI